MKNYTELIKKYYEGETTLEEEQELAIWLLKNRPKEYAALTEEFSFFEEYKHLKYRRPNKNRWMKVVAGLAVFFTSAILLMQNNHTTYLTSNETKKFTLPDGSNIVLNRNTKVILDDEFNQNNRNLKLDGQAFFDVKKDSIPFVISFNESKVTVLGTKFSVNTKDVHVYVEEGEVKLTSSDNEAIKISNGKETVRVNTAKAKTRYNENPNIISWVNKNLKFNRRPLNEAILDIEKHFGVRIQIKNKHITDEFFTGNFYSTDLETVIKSICLVFDYTYKISDDKTSVSLST